MNRLPKLLAHVAYQVGVALHALQVQESMQRLETKAKLVDALVSGVPPARPRFSPKPVN
ncbi:MAG TPA: hypothetical protein VNF46_02075 [Gammaproteobacteria bacterium]|nr:hypothetical protein [Gammaproteobacteria bacterium]